ncbi:PucR family transcriptional regulator [Mycolicibacterium sp. 120270]|uniref:PucR family transcriptional regulator n=1 Tax=Mycolicibacterium sp. 120270 TaxID=3090600 RepID=UPI00299E44FA|nr:helix-turn-helix domain-containing protein [Mycolicibacterium sp. 120270]MDX1882205.1 helix-turn-helix domain-containing protein [Mycolicibacterium sp. 120270]
MEPSWDGIQRDDERRVWATVLRPAAGELAERAGEIAAVANVHTSARLPELLASAEALEVNRSSTEASIRDFAAVLMDGADPAAAADLPAATLAYARDGAQHGVELTTLMRSYRLAHAAIARCFSEILDARASNADDRKLAAELGSAWMFAYVDAALCQAEQVYTAERDRWSRSAAASQVETITTILAGQPIDNDVATRRLRHEVRRWHIAAVAWLDTHEEGSNTQAILEAAIRDIASAVGNQNPLLYPLGILSVAAWVSSHSEIPSNVLNELRIRASSAPGARVAIGEPGYGLAGFRSSYVEALEAQRIARLAQRPVGTVTRYQAIALRAIATVDIEQSRTFVRRELGRLGETDETTRRLAATVRAFLDENCSRGRTAKRLHVHENTVAYRIRQAEELLGRPVDKRTLELRAALALADLVVDHTEVRSRSVPDTGERSTRVGSNLPTSLPD